MPVVIRVSCESSLALGATNVWHAQIPDSARVTEANAFVNALDAFYTAIASLLVAGTIQIGNRVTTASLDPNQVIGATAQIAATTGVVSSAVQAAIVCSLQGTNIGPRYRGRIYLGPLDDSAIQSDGFSVNTGAQTTIATALSTLRTSGGSNYTLGIYSRKYNTFEPMTLGAVRGTIGTQRRRVPD